MTEMLTTNEIADILREQVRHGNDPGTPPDVSEPIDMSVSWFCLHHKPPFFWSPENIASLCSTLTEYQVRCVADALCLWWNICTMWGDDHPAVSMMDSLRRGSPNAVYILGALALINDITVRHLLVGPRPEENP